MNSMACPLFIRLCNRNGDNKSKLDGRGEINNILIENIKAKNIEIPIMIMGIPNQKISDVNLKNFDLKYAEGKDYFDLRFKIPEQEKEYPECNRFRNINAYGVFVRHAKNILLENINVKPRTKTYRKFKKIIDWASEKATKRIAEDERLRTFTALGLFLFVAIPLPGTGAWTGSLIANFLDLPVKKAFWPIVAGVFTAGVIMLTGTAIANGGIQFLLQRG